jgi:hypothetical protein
MMRTEDEAYESQYCYLVVLKFESEEEPLTVRIREHVPIIQQTLKDLSISKSKPMLAFQAKDGSVIGIVLRSTRRADDILRHIHSHTPGVPSPTRMRDQIAVMQLALDFEIQSSDRLSSWLKQNRIL